LQHYTILRKKIKERKKEIIIRIRIKKKKRKERKKEKKRKRRRKRKKKKEKKHLAKTSKLNRIMIIECFISQGNAGAEQEVNFLNVRNENSLC